MKIYLAGPMTGLPDDHYPAFHAAAARLRALGHEVINPAELHDPCPKGLSVEQRKARWIACMKVDLPHLFTCQSVAVLPNWERSSGARLEVMNGAMLGMPILLEETLQPINGGARALIHQFLTPPP